MAVGCAGQRRRPTVQMRVAELHAAVEATIGRACRAEAAALQQAALQPPGREGERGGALQLYGAIHQLRETAEGIASRVARLTADLQPRHLR